MKKEIKVLHLNDGTPIELTKNNRHYAEEFVWAETMIEEYLNVGYRIVSALPDVTPAINEPGNYSFYNTGITVVLEREVKPDNVEITKETWDENNKSDENEPDFGYGEEDFEFDFSEDDDDGEGSEEQYYFN